MPTMGQVPDSTQDPEPDDLAALVNEGAAVQLPPTPETHITLPGGLVAGPGEILDQAEVRELNGEDEEALARMGDNVTLAKRYSTILQRCLVSLNESEPRSIEVDSLLLGDRDELLLAIRKATYGTEMEIKVTCPHCSLPGAPRTFDIALELDKDIPHKEMEEKAKRIYTVKLRKSEAEIRLATGADQLEAVANGNRTIPEINTIVLSRCLQKLDGVPVSNLTSVVLKMGVADRDELLKVITEKQPGPQMQDIKVNCTWCAESIDLPMQIADIFRP